MEIEKYGKLEDWFEFGAEYFWDRKIGLETEWRIFCAYWIPFFYDDERNIIVNPKSKHVLTFTLHGRVEKGCRKSRN